MKLQWQVRSSAIRRPAGRKGRSRRTCEACPPSALAIRAELPLARGAEHDWLETRCRELWAQTPHGSHPGMISDVWSEEAQHLMQLPRPFDGFGRIRQARVADVPDPSGPQSLQRAGVVRQSSGQRTSVSRAHRHRRRGADRVRASSCLCPLSRTEEHHNGLRLAAPSGGRSTQAGSPAQRRAFRRTAARLPGSATAHDQDAGRRPRDGRDLGAPSTT